MHFAVAGGSIDASSVCRSRGIQAVLCAGKVAEPWVRCEHGQKTAGAQQLATQVPANGDVLIKSLLLDFVHVRQTVCSAPSEDRVRQVLAQDSRPHFVAAAKQVSAVVVMR